MLDKYKDEQPILYNLLENSIKKDKISHAYLFETNNNPNSLDIVYSFVKELICPNDKKCDNCSICKRIDDGNYLDVKVINPDGLQIKKEQLLDLQDEFSKVSIENNKKVYIINECEKMNLQASNSILKFLEEPIDNIIAILVTNNIIKVLKTIISRCQVISLNKSNNKICDTSFENISYILTNNSSDREKFLLLDSNKEFMKDVLNFISYYEDNGVDTLVYVKKLWHDKFKDRQSNINAMDIMINFYYDVFKYKISGNVIVFVDKLDLIKKVSSNDINKIMYKMELLIEMKKLIGNNLNTNLLIDYMIIKLGG